MRKMELHGIPQPDYAKEVYGCCRMLCRVVGTDYKGLPAVIEEGDLVFVSSGHYLDDPTPEDDNFRFIVELLKRSGKRDRRYITYDGCARNMLEPEPGVIDWPPEYSEKAMEMGWEIFYCDGSEGPLWQLQKLDDDPDDRLKDDVDAFQLVWRRATKEGCPVCKHALSFLYYRSPKEYANIKKHGKESS